MKAYQLDITLKEDLVMSATSSTLGGNHSLDYVSGAALLGAAAAKLYSKVSTETAFYLFHSGKVRFGNAYPVHANEPARPIPLAWHRLRTNSKSPQILNHLLDDGDSTKVKQEQLRSGYVTDSGQMIHPRTSFRMKTAIDPKTASAATAQLFGYQAIQAGQKFRATLSVESHELLTTEVIDSLLKVFSGTLLLGRSRSAQYGEASCEVTSLVMPTTNFGDESDSSLTLWLQSDLALQDENGQPVLFPEAKYFGINGELDHTRSFLQFRNYSPYNSFRKSYDTVRQVITQGSVIGFKLNTPVSDSIKESWLSGVGLYRECGLGQILANPLLLKMAVPTPSGIKPVTDQVGEPPDHPLAKWLLSQTHSGGLQRRLREQAERCGRELALNYESARRYAGESSGLVVGPGRSQWGKVLEIAKQYASGGESEGLMFALFDEKNKQAVCGTTDINWQVPTGPSKNDNFAFWFKKHLQMEADNPGLLAANVAQIARSVVAKQEGEK